MTNFIIDIAVGVALWLTVRTVCLRFNLWPYRSAGVR